MNRREFGRANFGLLLIVMLALAPTAWGNAIPNEVKQADDVSAYQTSITEAVKASVADLAAGKEEARDELINDALLPGQLNNGMSTASPAYLDAFDAALNTALVDLAKNNELSVRLNAAIVAARVAGLSNNTRLADAIQAFVEDKSDAVVLWGVRGARAIIPDLLRGPFKNPNHPLITAVVDSVNKHKDGVAAGWIATAAYDALALDLFNQNHGGRVTPDMISGTIEPLQKLMAERLDQYKVEVPPDTAADRTGASYLTDGGVWAAQTPEQQVRTMQLLSNLLSLAAQQAQAQSKTENSTDIGELLNTVQLTARAISVAAQNAGEPALVSAVSPVTALSKAMPPAKALKLVEAVYPAFKQTTKFTNVTEPPTIQATKAAPPPASAPTKLPPGMAAPLPPPPPPPPPPPTETKTGTQTRPPVHGMP
jgi:hypothetical protein